MKVKFGEKIENIMGLLLGIAVTGMLAIFTVNSLLFTGYNGIDNAENILYKHDNVFLNVVGLIIICVVFYGMYRLIDFAAKKIPMAAIISIFMVVALFFGVYWVANLHALPLGDGYYVCTFAAEIETGNFVQLGPGGYLTIYPQQLGMVTLMRVLYRLFGLNNTYSFEYLNACAMPFIILAGYGIVHELTGSKRAEILSVLMIFFFSPLYFYTSNVYNDELALVCMMLAIWCMLAFMRTRKVIIAILMGLFVAAAIQLRLNSTILLVAMAIVIIIQILTRKEWQKIFVLAGMIILCMLSDWGIKKIYESAMDKNADAMPRLLHIAMGQQESELGPGWYNGYNWEVFNSVGCDADKASEIAMADLKERMSYFAAHPMEALDFYTRKINTQWNVPMYQGLAMSNRFEKEQEGIIKEVYTGKLHYVIEEYLNIFHLLVMLMSMLYIIVLIKEKAKIEKYILALVVFGGFIFSIIWEAKSRYVMPYFVMLIPYAGIELGVVCEKAEKLICAIFSKKA